MDQNRNTSADFAQNEIRFTWLAGNSAYSEELAGFFEENVDEKYISHGEVAEGRADSFTEWKKNLREVMEAEFKEILSATPGSSIYSRICICSLNNKLAGMALIAFREETKVAVIEDIIIGGEFRKRKLGSLFLEWIEKEISLKAMSFIMLESGINNKRAHNFFHGNGYQQASVVMVKKL